MKGLEQVSIFVVEFTFCRGIYFQSIKDHITRFVKTLFLFHLQLFELHLFGMPDWAANLAKNENFSNPLPFPPNLESVLLI